MSEQIKLATFKVNGDRWAAFVSGAAAQNTSASALLKGFIDRYLEGSIDGGICNGIDDSIGGGIDRALIPIRQEVQELRQKLESLTILGNQTQELRTEGTNTRSSKAKPVVGHSEGEELGDRRLSRGEAHQLAKSRGYLGAVTSMNRDLAAGTLEPFGVAIVEKSERQIGNRAKNYVELGKG